MSKSDAALGGAVLVGCLLLLLWAFVGFPLLLMWAWNTFAVAVFGAPAINFLQALAASVLIGVLRSIFGGLRASSKS